jgi:hypothetical protein
MPSVYLKSGKKPGHFMLLREMLDAHLLDVLDPLSGNQLDSSTPHCLVCPPQLSSVQLTLPDTAPLAELPISSW